MPTTFKVVVEDATAPVIGALSTSPSFIWPANGKWIAVSVSVSASDDVDAAPVCALSGVSGAPASDVVVTGPLSARVRAVRNADGSTRVYLFEVSCHDAAGNASTAAASVSVSKDEAQKVYHYNTRMRTFVAGLLRAAERRGW